MAKAFTPEYYKEAEIDEIRAELMRIKIAPAKGVNRTVTARNYRTGVEVTIINDGEAISVNIRSSKKTAGVVLSRVEYRGNYAKVDNADRALIRALQQSERKLATQKF